MSLKLAPEPMGLGAMLLTETLSWQPAQLNSLGNCAAHLVWLVAVLGDWGVNGKNLNSQQPFVCAAQTKL